MPRKVEPNQHRRQEIERELPLIAPAGIAARASTIDTEEQIRMKVLKAVRVDAQRVGRVNRRGGGQL